MSAEAYAASLASRVKAWEGRSTHPLFPTNFRPVFILLLKILMFSREQEGTAEKAAFSSPLTLNRQVHTCASGSGAGALVTYALEHFSFWESAQTTFLECQTISWSTGEDFYPLRENRLPHWQACS